MYSRRAQERARQFSWQRTMYWHRAIYQRLMALQRFGKTLQTEKEGIALENLLHDTIATLGASAGSIMLLEPRRQVLHLRATKGLPTGVKQNGGQPLEQGIAGFVASRKMPLILPEAFESIAAHGGVTYPQRSHIHSALSVPIHTDDRTLGVINLSSHVHGRRFKHDDLDWLSTLARQAADALSKASLS